MSLESSDGRAFCTVEAGPGRGGAELRRMIEESEPFALTGVVVAEVLQGTDQGFQPHRRVPGTVGHAGAAGL